MSPVIAIVPVVHSLYPRIRTFLLRAFGTFLHHTPAVVLSERRKSNEGLRRVWWYCCKYENIDPVHPIRVPLLFALDSKANIPNGGGGCGGGGCGGGGD
jgi:hypothetical protein